MSFYCSYFQPEFAQIKKAFSILFKWMISQIINWEGGFLRGLYPADPNNVIKRTGRTKWLWVNGKERRAIGKSYSLFNALL